jgi:hypothetical protein
MREPFPPRRREKEKVKSQRETREDPTLPFIRQGEQVTLVKREKEGDGLCMHDRCVGGGILLLQRVPLSIFAAAVACSCLSWCRPFICMWQEQ